MKELLVFPHFADEDSWGSERLRDFPRVTQLGSSRVKVQTMYLVFNSVSLTTALYCFQVKGVGWGGLDYK